MSKLPLIIKREYYSRVRNKSFVIMTFLSPLILVGMIFLIAYLTQLNEEGRNQVIYLDETGYFVEDFAKTENTVFVDMSDQSVATVKEIVKQGEYYGFVHIEESVFKTGTFRFYGKETPSLSFVEDLEGKIENRITDKKLLAQGIDLNVLKDAKTEVGMTIENFAGERTNKLSNIIKAAFGGAAGYLLMMFIIIYGNMVMRSVIEEKTNRIIEVIISSVKPFQLMMGKILGTTMAGITQFAIWVILGAILLTVFAIVFGLDSAQASIPQSQAMQEVAGNEEMIQAIFEEVIKLPLLQLVVYFFIYFIGGYFLYSSIYASIGAAVDSETDTQQFMLPIIMPLMLGIYVGFFAVINNPHGTVSTIFSMIPLTSPIVMLMRIPFGVPWWQLVISITLLIATFTATVYLGAKIYRVGILMYGKKASYKELYKWLKYKS